MLCNFAAHSLCGWIDDKECAMLLYTPCHSSSHPNNCLIFGTLNLFITTHILHVVSHMRSKMVSNMILWLEIVKMADLKIVVLLKNM